MYPLIQEISSEYRAVPGNRDSDRRAELAWPLTPAAKGREKSATRRAFLHTVVMEVRHNHTAPGANRECGDRDEPTVKQPVNPSRERSTPFAHEATLRVEHMNPVAITIGHVKIAFAVQSDITRIDELPCPMAGVSGGSPLPRKRPIGEQLLHALIVEIGYKNITVGRYRHPHPRVELGRPAVVAANDPLRRAVQAEHLNAVVDIRPYKGGEQGTRLSAAAHIGQRGLVSGRGLTSSGLGCRSEATAVNLKSALSHPSLRDQPARVGAFIDHVAEHFGQKRYGAGEAYDLEGETSKQFV